MPRCYPARGMKAPMRRRFSHPVSQRQPVPVGRRIRGAAFRLVPGLPSLRRIDEPRPSNGHEVLLLIHRSDQSKVQMGYDPPCSIFGDRLLWVEPPRSGARAGRSGIGAKVPAERRSTIFGDQELYYRPRWLAICLRYAMRALRSVSASTVRGNAGICCWGQVLTDLGSRTNARIPASVR
jgi:hypothetical protein